MPFHHITSYEAILGVTEVRLWEVALKGGAWLGTASVWFKHSRCQKALSRVMCSGLCIASAFNALDHFTVVGSLILSPVPNVARVGVTLAGASGALADWSIFVASLATYSWLAHHMAAWKPELTHGNI